MTYKIQINGDTADVYTPYSWDFVFRIKMIGGAHWNPSKKCWTVPAGSVDIVRDHMRACYGRDDLSEGETVRVLLTFADDVSVCCGGVTIYGHTIAVAYGRDSGAHPGDDVAYISGSCTSGGSARNWDTIVKAGSVVELGKVSKILYDTETLPSGVTSKLVADNSNGRENLNRAALLAERDRLMARIAEIDKSLADLA